MANWSLKWSIETPSTDNFIEVIKIDSLNELKKTLWFEQLGIEEEFKKPLITSKTELLKMKEELTRDKTSWKLRELLEGKWVISLIWSKFEKASKTVKEILPSQKVSAEQADKALDAVLETSKEVWWEAWEAVRKWVSATKEAIASTNLSNISEKVWNVLKWVFEWFQKLWNWLMNLFKGLFAFITWKEALKNWVKDWAEKVKEKLSPENVELTKNQIKDTLLTTFPDKEEYINKVLNDKNILTWEKLESIYKKLNAWEKINLAFLKEEFRELEIQKLLNEKSEEYLDKLHLSILKNIETKYNKSLDKEQAWKLREIVWKYLSINPENIENIEQRIVNENQVQIKDIAPILSEMWENTVWFMLALVSEWIIDVSELAIDFVSKWADLIKISLWFLWLSEVVNLEDIYKNIEDLDDEQKAILIGLLYRKWGLFLNILWTLTAWVSKLALETILPTNAWVDGIKLATDSLFKWNLKQVENFWKIEEALKNTKHNTNWKEFLDEAIENLEKIKKNFITIELLKSSNWDIDKFYKNLADFEARNNINLKIEKYDDFNKLKRNLAGNMSIWFATKHNLDIRDIKNKALWFGINDAIQNFNSNIEKIANNQYRIAMWKLNLNPLKKLTDAIDISQVSKLWDSLMFEMRSKDDAKAFLKQMNELAKKSPDLIKWIFDKLPIIAVWWLAASWEEPFFESLQKEIPYLIPVVWPIMMVWNAWIDWKSFPPKIIDPEVTAIAWWLITLDWYFLFKEKGLINKWKYIIKPLTDIYDIWKWSVEVSQRLYKWIRVSKWAETAWKILGEGFLKAKNIKWPALVKAIWLAAILAYSTYEIAFSDDEIEELADYTKDWKLDLDKIKSDRNKLSNENKLEIAKLILNEDTKRFWIENLNWINLKIENNEITINSSNEKIAWDWIISSDFKKILNDLIGIEKVNFSYLA